jgi:hypothetical protein
MVTTSTKRKPVLLALGASLLLTILIVVGSRNLEHYDSALFGYTVASVVAFGAVVFRYAIWLQRPATRVYWKRVAWIVATASTPVPSECRNTTRRCTSR